jgi:hypothetical protein
MSPVAPLFTKVQKFEIMPAVQTDKKYKFGSIKNMVVTFPKVKTTFSGCKYNKISVGTTPELTKWINELEQLIKALDNYDVVSLIKYSSEYLDEIRLKFPPSSILVNAMDNTEVDPNDLKRNTLIVPIVRLGYYINGRKIGLVATMLKGLVYEKEMERVEFEADL